VRLLLDTHAFVWWLNGDGRLTGRARRAIADESNQIFVSAASAWELATKARLGKLPAAADVAADVPTCIADQGFQALDVTVLQGQRAGELAGSHRDPFDRMLMAQALTDGLTLVSNDEVFDAYGVRRFW
jgi:PIN domain nuclease of toxin-antitoxin system